ncbi:MAG: citrate synthase [Betaproteobacteria bacterium]|nr:citrate synthase [Betaproteobacteria bacterium]
MAFDPRTRAADPRTRTADSRSRPANPRARADSLADYLSRSEALRILRVKPQTLYCYVSRGFIRRVPQPVGRSSYYLREDVEKMRMRSTARAGHGPAAASAMRWGAPAIVTSVTEITDSGPRYRERLAVDLARANHAFENVAEYLWTGTLLDEPLAWRAEPGADVPHSLLVAQARIGPGMPILQRLAATVLAMGALEGNLGDRLRSGGTPVTSARRLIRAMTGTFGCLGPLGTHVPIEDGEPIVGGLARALGVAADNSRLRALNAMLVLIADHELNPATFAARVAASGGADLHACISAALNVHTGRLIGGVPESVERLFAPGAGAKVVVGTARKSIGAAERLPGFNHPLYPRGDPRAEMMIELARGFGRTQPARGMLEAMDRLKLELAQSPSIEAGLVTLCRAIGAPAGTASGLFAFGRVAGWVAHILEQRLQGFMIRPRAKFVRAA